MKSKQHSEAGRIGGFKKVATKGFGYKKECNCSTFSYSHYVANCAGQKGGLNSKRVRK